MIRRILHSLAGALFLTAFFAALPVRAQAPVPDSPAIEKKADAMLAKLTLGEKIDLLGGEDNMFIRAEPAAGFPRLKMSDGPTGVRTWGPDTAYTAGIALAASWDPALAERVGVSIGRDARARGVNFLLGPGVDIYRAPMNGRNFEYFGEDPYLASRIVVGYVNGVQSQGVVATIKHFALNEEEYDRHNVSSDADERTMREIYFPAFEAGVREAHAGAIMDSYNLVNGVHATQNGFLNNQVLKKDWGFDGIVMSDWTSTYDGVAAANNGLDLEMPFAIFMTRKTLLPAIREGKVSEAAIDDKVRRIFRTALRFGFLDRPQTDLSIPRDNPQARQTALDEARESIVLLKNENGLLPLDPAKIHTVAVLGPDAWPAVTGGGGSSIVTPYNTVGILDGLNQIGGWKVLYARGIPTLEELFEGTTFAAPAPGSRDAGRDAGANVRVETFANDNFSGKPESVSYVSNIASWHPRVWGSGAASHRSVRWTAIYLPQSTGSYLFVVAATATDAYKLYVNGKVVVQESRHESQAPHSGEFDLTAGQPASIRLDYQPGGDEQFIGMGIRAMSDLISPEAKEIAAQADAAIVSVGFDSTTESEGFDRSYALPYGQDALIEAVRAVNKNTIVALTAGGDVDTRGWIAKIPALIHNWYPGQEGGTALAEILAGVRSPEGKLPISFPVSWEQNPVHDHYYPPPTPAGQTPRVKYAEGVFLGYRYFTSTGERPLFPFGFGLSYTTFSFGNLQISPRETSGDQVTVSFDVTNTGARPGAEVAQLYVGDPSARVTRPAKELKGFEKVRLDPGQSQRITFSLDKRSLAYWDDASHGWRVDPGKFVVYAGDSSENTPLRADFTVAPK